MDNTHNGLQDAIPASKRQQVRLTSLTSCAG